MIVELAVCNHIMLLETDHDTNELMRVTSFLQKFVQVALFMRTLGLATQKVNTGSCVDARGTVILTPYT